MSPEPALPVTDHPDPALQELLAPPRPWWRRPALWLALALVPGAAAGAWLWLASRSAAQAPRFVTEATRRGDLSLTVIANGTLQPTSLVSIGSELSGTVLRVRVDVNDVVRKGQVLLELDTAKLNDEIVRSRAGLASAVAAVSQAEATLSEAGANLNRLEQVARLSGGKVPSGAELDTARATLARARANLASAQANVQSARATLSTDETNLSKASIRSPIDGVILTRSVDPGNAVAASLQAVTLFTIAEDLRHLRLQVNVDEADVGAVRNGQDARFTVSAWPNRHYPARITRVAYGSTITDNVVTYITYLDVANDDLSLRPGMTATASINAAERHDVLLVPNTALRFTPSQGAPAAGKSGLVASLMPRGPGAAQRRPAAASASTAGSRQLWVLSDGVARALAVTPGISDGHLTEITGGALQAGMQVITEQRAATP